MQNKPNLPDTQMFISASTTKRYKNIRLHGYSQNKPNQTQFMPKVFMPKVSTQAHSPPVFVIHERLTIITGLINIWQVLYNE